MSDFVKLRGDDAQRVLGNALLFAADDDSRPVLTGVRLIAENKVLWAVGCDPYSCAWDSAETLDGGDLRLTLRREAAEFILRELKTYAKKSLGDVSVLIAEDQVVVESATFAHAPVDGNYPDFLSVVPKVTEATETIALSPFLIGRLAKVRGASESRWTFSGKVGAVSVSIGRTFRAVIMPLRIDSAIPAAAAPPAVAKAAA